MSDSRWLDGRSWDRAGAGAGREGRVPRPRPDGDGGGDGDGPWAGPERTGGRSGPDGWCLDLELDRTDGAWTRNGNGTVPGPGRGPDLAGTGGDGTVPSPGPDGTVPGQGVVRGPGRCLDRDRTDGAWTRTVPKTGTDGTVPGSGTGTGRTWAGIGGDGTGPGPGPDGRCVVRVMGGPGWWVDRDRDVPGRNGPWYGLDRMGAWTRPDGA